MKVRCVHCGRFCRHLGYSPSSGQSVYKCENCNIIIPIGLGDYTTIEKHNEEQLKILEVFMKAFAKHFLNEKA